jgi:hypothetical protein
MYTVLADVVLVAHLGFVLFVVFGGVLVLRWRWVRWLHLPAVAWGAAVEFAGWICPLTPLEDRLREQAGSHGYQSDFVSRYLLPALYPEGLTRTAQIALGLMVLSLNVAIYAFVLRRRLPPTG